LLGEEEDESVQKLLENMMNHLMCKDVLYEPLKELNDKVGRSSAHAYFIHWWFYLQFPSYLASNEGKLSESDLARYKAQHVCTSKIVALFEDPGYKDDDPKMTADVVALMSEVHLSLCYVMWDANLSLRCRNMDRRRGKSWVNYRLGSMVLTDSQKNCQRNV
jgi:Pex19 protein family